MGILVMNSVSFGLGNESYYDPSLGAVTALDTWLAGFGEVFADQKFMGLFSLLFGASLLLFLDRVSGRSDHPARLSLWRNFLLLVMGVLHTVLWIGDVLVTYALCAPVLLLFRNARAQTLVVLGVVLFGLSVPLGWWAGTAIDDATIRAVWRGVVKTPDQELFGLYILTEQFLRAMGMMLLGMGLFRSGHLVRPIGPTGIRWSVVAIVVAAAVSGVGLFQVAAQGGDAGALVVGNMANGVATIPMTLGYLGVLMGWDQRSTGRLIRRVRSLGRMALTNYLGQTVLGVLVFALVPKEDTTRTLLWAFVLVVWAIQLWASDAWLGRFRMGPLEWLWRCATYRRWEPLRRG